MLDRMDLPESLREAVARDLRPVRPLRAPWQRALVLSPVAAVLLVGVPFVFGLREDAGELGRALLWGLSAAQVFAGLALVGVALREAVPARGLSAGALLSTFAAALVLVALATFGTNAASPTRAPADQVWFYWKVCFGLPVLLGLPVVVTVGWLAARALPLRPAVAGALYGLGSGLLVDAGWRLFCHVSEPGHVLAAHGAAMLALAAAGALVASVWARLRWAQGRRSGR